MLRVLIEHLKKPFQQKRTIIKAKLIFSINKVLKNVFTSLFHLTIAMTCFYTVGELKFLKNQVQKTDM